MSAANRIALIAFAQIMLFAADGSAALASCQLANAVYSSNGWSLSFSDSKPPGFTLSKGSYAFQGLLAATNNYGAVEYMLGKEGSEEYLSSGLIYGAVGSSDGKTSEVGVWYDQLAPPTIILPNLDRAIFYLLKDNGSTTEQSPGSDFFPFQRCR